MKKILLLLLSFVFGVSGLLAQGTIKGKVIDDSGEPVLFGTIAIYKGGALIKGTQTDFDGNYLISNVDPGTYDLEASYVGLQSKKITGISVSGDETKFIDIELASGLVLEEVVVVEFKKELFNKGETTTGGTVTSDEIKNLGLRSVNNVAATTAGVSVGTDGQLNIRGGRGENTVYFIDGQRVRGAANLAPINEYEQVQILTGGVSARYGDVIGGVVSLTSKGPSSKFSGSIDVENSYGLDPFGYLRINGSVSGPILKTKPKNETDIGRTILGYRLNAQYQSRIDDDPPATDIYSLKGDALEQLKSQPILFEDGAVTNASTFITNEDVEVMDYQPDEERDRIDLGAKIDAYLGAGIDVTLSGQYFDQYNKFTPGEDNRTGTNWRVFNSYRNPIEDFEGYRGSFRFRQRLGDGQNDSIQGFIRNVSYTLQLGYDKDVRDLYDSEHKDNIFNYGYYGAYDFSYQPAFNTDFQTQVTSHVDYTTVLDGYTPGSTFGINEVLSNYNPKDVGNINELTMRNGENIRDLTEVWGLHDNVGQIYNFNVHREREIYQFDANASFDIVPPKNSDRSHNIQFGILYEERVERQFDIRPRRLWITMRQLANGHLGGLDTTNVIDRVPNPNPLLDSIDIYANTYTVGENSRFLREIRKITGDPVDMFTNVEGVDPNLLSLDMFSGRELHDANVVRSSHGYDYTGKRLGTDVSFDDFWKTEEGRQNFMIAPNNPIYQAAYIQDKFSFEDIIFRVGIRVDRYDANTKVLKDPYSIKNIMTADQFHGETGIERPGGIGDDYKVYVTSSGGSEVQAYRNGDTWYNAEGTQVNDGSVIFGGGIVFPRFTDPDIEVQNVREFSNILDKSFEDYEPQVNVMPRLSFSFPISDEANFFAHYDILVQRPTSNTILTPLDFFYWEFDNRVANNVRNNSNLKPQKTVDYQVGFQQKLSDFSVMKLSAYYKEIRDLIQWRTYLFNPEPLGSYATYDNQDFGTVKGFTLSYDLRRKRNVQLNANYTLQFADGTGSSPETQQSISELGNLRNIFPLSFDERHRFVMILDYRYGSGKEYNGPKLWGKEIFANTGLNLQGTLVTGRPYTEKITPRKLDGAGTVGSLNGARLPSQFTINARLDKDILLGKGENALNVNLFLRCSNLLDARNIIRVYPATGSPDDDGYLASPAGQGEIATLAGGSGDINSFLNSYDWRLVNPNFYSGPRRFFVGAVVLF